MNSSWGNLNQQYASAEFENDNQPIAVSFDMSGSGNDRPYTTALTTIISSSVDEMNSVVRREIPKTEDWRKRLREFLSKKNTDLLDFLNLSVPSHPTLGKGDALLWKFNSRNLIPFAGLVKKAVIDVSGADIFSEMKAAISEFRTDNSVADLKATVQYIYDEYRKAGDAILRAESVMKVKLEVFDKIQKTIVGLLELEPNCATNDLMKETENYLENIFEKNNIKSAYEELVGAYRRFVVLREFVQMFRISQSNENEPLCTICLESPVTHCTNPCGHTYCEHCLKRQKNTCFMCRTPVENTIRLYFG